MNENWLSIPNYPNYEVSDLGNFRRADTKKLLKLSTNGKKNYRTVRVMKEGKQKVFFLHTLMLTLFVGPRPEGSHGRHKDDNKHNNVLNNLEWKDAVEHNKEHGKVIHKGKANKKAVKMYD